MTGIIVQLPPEGRTGVIRTDDGFRFPFAAADVIGDSATLARGHRVSFEIQNKMGERKAIGVLRELPKSSGHQRRSEVEADLRYMGFDQTPLERRYRFDAVGTGLEPAHFIVTVNLEVLLKSHVSVQELPQLCMRKLAADLKTAGAPTSHLLAEDDLNAFTSARAAKLERKRPRPIPNQRRTPPAWGGQGGSST